MINSIVKQIQGWAKLKGATDGSMIGNILDALRVDFPEHRVDNFGLQKVSQPITLFESGHAFGKDTVYWDERITGGATSIHNANTVSIDMSTGTALGDRAIRRTFRRFPYFKGKSQIWLGTGKFGTSSPGVRKRYGLYNDSNGIYFQQLGDTFSIVRRSKISGVVTEQVIDQVDWNEDKLDGTGKTKRTVDFSEKQIVYYIDFSWLGSGDIFYGVLIDRKIIFCNKINVSTYHSDPWSQTGTLPVTAEIENLTAQASSNTMRVTCNSVISSGGRVDYGNVQIIDSGSTPIAITNTDQVISGIRLKQTIDGASLRPISFNIQPVSGNGTIYWRVYLRDTLTGGVFAQLPNSDITEYLTNPSAITFTGGRKVASGYISLAKGDTVSFPLPIESDTFLGWDLDHAPDNLILVVRTDSGLGEVLFSQSFREYY